MVYRVKAPSEMVYNKHVGRCCAAVTPSWSKAQQLATLPNKRKTVYLGSTCVYFTVASYWLIDDCTSIVCVAGTALLKLYTIPVHLYLVARAISKHKKQFANKPRWLGRIRDHRRKGLGKTHPIILCRFSVVHYLRRHKEYLLK